MSALKKVGITAQKLIIGSLPIVIVKVSNDRILSVCQLPVRGVNFNIFRPMPVSFSGVLTTPDTGTLPDAAGEGGTGAGAANAVVWEGSSPA